jgi:hypothetical protein
MIKSDVTSNFVLRFFFVTFRNTQKDLQCWVPILKLLLFAVGGTSFNLQEHSHIFPVLLNFVSGCSVGCQY